MPGYSDPDPAGVVQYGEREPRTAAGRKARPWLAGSYFTGDPAAADQRAVEAILAIETEAADFAGRDAPRVAGPEPRTEAGRALLSWDGSSDGSYGATDYHGGSCSALSGHPCTCDLPASVLAIEAEAVRRDRAALAEAWADARRTKGSLMHDVGGVMAVVDALIEGPK